jgi:uncharacterized iron-regulated membrane protein
MSSINSKQLSLNSRHTRLKSHRKQWLKVHLYLGLVLGFFLSLFGLTGSILVFYEEINELLYPAYMTVSASPEGEQAFQPFQNIMATATTAIPVNAKLRFIACPKQATSSYQFNYQIPVANNDQMDEWRLFINPYSAEVLGTLLIKKAENIFPSLLMPVVFRLHFALLAGETGGMIVGIIGMVLVFSVLTGLILWWPLTGNWRRVLIIKRRASVERFNHDLHQTFGFYSSVPLLLILISGVYMNLPDQFMTLIKLFSPTTESFADNPKSAVVQGEKPIGLSAALESARSHYPEGHINWLSLADGEQGVYIISFIDLPELSAFWSERQVIVDQYSGKILKVQDPSNRKSVGQTIVDWQWPLHSGKAFAWTGRILVFLSGLACPVLFITGVIRWLQKRRAKKRSVYRK